MERPLPISEVAARFEVKAYVLRYWETEFEQLRPGKNKAGHRIYRAKDLAVLERIVYLLRKKKYTIEGARQVMADEENEEIPVANLKQRAAMRELRGFLTNLLRTME